MHIGVVLPGVRPDGTPAASLVLKLGRARHAPWSLSGAAPPQARGCCCVLVGRCRLATQRSMFVVGVLLEHAPLSSCCFAEVARAVAWEGPARLSAGHSARPSRSRAGSLRPAPASHRLSDRRRCFLTEPTSRTPAMPLCATSTRRLARASPARPCVCGARCVLGTHGTALLLAARRRS